MSADAAATRVEMPAGQIHKAELFARLAAGAGAGGAMVVVTPNRRLAQSLAQQFDAHQLAAGRSQWGAPDILPFNAFVERAFEQVLYAEHGADLSMLLTPAQEQALWEGIVERSEAGAGLLALPQAAAMARDAWQTAHAWRLTAKLRHAARNEDTEAFVLWAQRYEEETRARRLSEAARLPELIAKLITEATVDLPALLVCYGFDILTPQQAELFDAFAAQGCEISACGPQSAAGAVSRLRCADASDEMLRAARWARARLEANDRARIGIVVPDLEKRRAALRRIFTRVMQPTARLAGATAGVLPFNISLGEALDTRPLVDCAFLVLELCGREIAFERASRLLRSPFVAAGDTELTRRAALDAALRQSAEPALGLDRLVTLLDAQAPAPGRTRVPVLSDRLARLAVFRRERLFAAQSPSQWARAFSEALALFGFPGERALDSIEYQTLKKWHEVLAQFARLDVVATKMGYGEACARLRRIAADTAFQPESPDVPVQILGVLESAGCEFDHLWVMGLTVEAWPLAARPNPFLPLVLQREAGIPESAAALSLELDRRITRGWMGAAPEVVFSHPRLEADRELAPSPLIAGLTEGQAPYLCATPDHIALLHASRLLERSEDAAAPPLVATPPLSVFAVRGGTALIRDQAACPFRAYARHRLGAESLSVPHTGLDALERGALVHQVLASAWGALETKHALDSIDDAALEALLEKAARDAMQRQRRERPGTLSGRFAGIEMRRLARLARDWLALERGRGDFSVFAVEAKRAIAIGGLEFNGRLDRVDETADGRRIVIDYKTRAPGVAAWLGERPEEPQLPLYLLAAEPAASAIAFAQVRAGEMKLVALAADDGILPGARTLPDGRLKRAADSWGEQLVFWRAELERLARGFAGGEAAVDPKPGACEYCDLKPLCRIHARSAAGDEAGDGA